MLTSLTILALTSSAGAATLNKCFDAKGQVTYSNLPCRNARETRTLEIDPAPLPDPVRSQSVEAQPVQAPPIQARPAKPVVSTKEPAATIQLETRRTPMGINSTDKPATRASAQQCDTLTDKLGRVFDRMDQARRKGYTQAQMDKWNQEVKDLERQKQRAGCF
jgi:hypothetical protein